MASKAFQNISELSHECHFALLIVKQPDLDLRVLSVVRDGYKKHNVSPRMHFSGECQWQGF